MWGCADFSQVGSRTEVDDAAVIKEYDAVGNFVHQVEVVGNHH